MQIARPGLDPLVADGPASGSVAVSTAGGPRLAPARPLPHAVTSFVGRERDVADVVGLLGAHRVVCLTGPGGTGKSRLAVEAARAIETDRVDGVRLLELAALTRGAQVLPTIAATLLAPGATTGDAPGEVLAAAIGDREVLLLLDNCEHLAAAVSRVVTGLVEACSGLRVLATSRHDLDVSGAVHLRVSPLATSDADGPAAAVRLFEDRARLATGRFDPTPESRRVVAEVCERLDGLPYAIELVASRLPALGVGDLMGWLDAELGVPTPGDVLGSLISWGREDLVPESRRLLDGLAVFAGSFDLDAVLQVATDEDHSAREVLGALADLVRRSLLAAGEIEGRVRYHLLRTTREYCQARLDESPDAVSWYQRHLMWVTDLVLALDPDAWFRQGIDRMPVARRHLADLRRAVETALTTGQLPLALPLASRALEVGFFEHAQAEELVATLEQVIDQAAETPSRDRLEAMLWLAEFLDVSNDLPAAERWFEAAVEEARRLDDPGLSSWTRASLGEFAFSRGHHADAVPRLTEACAGLCAVGRVAEAGLFRIRLAGALVALGRTDEAREQLERANDEMQSGQRRPEEIATVAATIVMVDGDPSTATGLLEDAVAVAREVREGHDACSLENLGAHRRLSEGPLAAAEPYREALAERGPGGPREPVIACVRGIAAAVAARGDRVTALRLLEGAAVHEGEPGAGHVVRLPAVLLAPALRKADAALRSSLHDALGAILVARIRGEAARSSLEEVVQLALRAIEEPGAPEVAQSDIDPTLSRLIRRGATWEVVHGGRSLTVAHAKGMAYLAELLARPDEEVHVLDLVGRHTAASLRGPAAARDAGLATRRGTGEPGAALDEQARRAYGARVEELRDRIEEGTEFGDEEAVARAQDELDAIARELAAAYGLGGRPRANGDVERARKAVAKCLRTAIDRVREHDPATARHLDVAVRTGTWCRYSPPEPVAWTVLT